MKVFLCVLFYVIIFAEIARRIGLKIQCEINPYFINTYLKLLINNLIKKLKKISLIQDHP